MRVDNFDITTDKIPYSEIEEGIKPTVQLLNGAGFRTIGSCEGHDGSFPWVNTTWADPYQVAEVLHHHGAQGFTINQRTEFLSKRRCLRYLAIEFWGRDCLPKLETVHG